MNLLSTILMGGHLIRVDMILSKSVSFNYATGFKRTIFTTHQ